MEVEHRLGHALDIECANLETAKVQQRRQFWRRSEGVLRDDGALSSRDAARLKDGALGVA